MHRRGFLGATGAALLARATLARAQGGDEPRYDLVLRGGLVVDGSGGPARKADVGIAGGVIRTIRDRAEGAALTGAQELDCTGKVVCPGFIDTNTHLELACYSSLRAYPLPTSETATPDWAIRMMLEQGVTTVLTGTAGRSSANVETWLAAREAEGMALNVASLVGGLTALEAGGGMAAIARDLAAGAYGVSLDLGGCEDARLGEALRALRLLGAEPESTLFVARLRDTGAGLVDSVREAVEIARGEGVRLHISRLRATLAEGWEKLPSALELIEQAIAEGVDITADTHAFPGCGIGLREAYLPGPVIAESARMDDAVIAAVAERLGALEPTLYYPRTQAIEGGYDYTLTELAVLGRSYNLIDFVVDLALRETIPAHGVARQGVYLAEMSLPDLYTVLAKPWVTLGSDAGAGPDLDAGWLFPWCFGNAPQALAQCARPLAPELLAPETPAPSPAGPAPLPVDRRGGEKPPPKVEPRKPTTEPAGPDAPGTGEEAPPKDPDVEAALALAKPFGFEEAVRRMTSLPARRLGLTDRGLLEVGAVADVVVLDPNRIRANGTPTTPVARPTGIAFVLLNGQLATQAGKWNGERRGKALRRGGA